jgi:hypothetical protein
MKKTFSVWIYFSNVFSNESGESKYNVCADSLIQAEIEALKLFWLDHDSKLVNFTGSEIE